MATICHDPSEAVTNKIEFERTADERTKAQLCAHLETRPAAALSMKSVYVDGLGATFNLDETQGLSVDVPTDQTKSRLSDNDRPGIGQALDARSKMCRVANCGVVHS